MPRSGRPLVRDAADVPVFVISRDRLTPLRQLVAWLEQIGVEEIYVLDNASAYEPLLEWYEASPHTIVRLGENFGKLALWRAPGVLDLARERPFVYTDPDVVPDPACPSDALQRFGELLDRYRLPAKAGFGLRIDDLPAQYRHRDAVVAAEAGFWQWPLERGAYWAPIDSTFALYRPQSEWSQEAIRTGTPYVARHTSWYLDLDHPSEEDAFYRARVETQVHWVEDDLGPYLAERALSQRPSATTRLRWRLRGRRAVRRGRS